MPDISTYSGVPVPTDGEANDLAGILAAFRATMDPQLVLKATSVSNRDTLYGGTTGATAVPAGTLVSCAALKTVWQKTSAPPSAATWATLAEVGTVVTSGVLTASTDWTASAQWAQRLNGVNIVRGRLTYSGADVTADPVSGTNPGSITDIQMASLQSAWNLRDASYSWTFSVLAGSGGGDAHIRSDSTLWLSNLGPSGKLRSGDVVAFAITYPGV